MRLLKLKIENYKLFKPIDIDFSDSKHISVFIGKNGSGKTTLIKALTHIFSNLFNAQELKHLNKVKFPFPFEVTFLLRREKINKTSFGGEFYINYIGVTIHYSEKLDITLYEEDKAYNGLTEIEKNLHAKGESIKYILPDNLAVYYSGISDTIYNVFSEFQKNIIFGTLTGDIKFDQPFYYFVPENFPVILITLLSFEYGDIPDYLKRQFEITGFSEIILNFKKPSWAKAKSTSQSFWGAMGELKQFLNILKGASSVNFSTDSITFKINSKSQLEQIWSFYGTEKHLFEYMVSLQANDLLSSIDLMLLKDSLTMSYQDLSEGEKQLLIIKGIKELLAAENSLFLLDEPDTYLHPEWKREFVYNLFDEYDDLDKNYSIITTHSPNIISALEKGQLKVLKNENGQSKIKQISFNPYGKPVDDILLEFFDIESLRYKKVQNQLDNIWSLIRANNYDTSDFHELFVELERSIGKSDKAITDIKIEIAKRRKNNEKN